MDSVIWVVAVGAVVAGFVHYLATNIVTRDMLPMFAIVAHAILPPTVLGARLYIGISEAAFRNVVLTLLTASGISLLASSVPQFLSRLSGGARPARQAPWVKWLR